MSLWIASAALLGAVLVGAVILALRVRRTLRGALASVADVEQEGPAHVRGTAGALTISVMASSALWPRRIAVEVRGSGLPPNLRARPGGGGLAVGERSFDKAVFVEGDLREALAALRRSARAAVLALVEAGGRVDAGRVVLERTVRVVSVAEVANTIRPALEAARELDLGRATIPEVLARNAFLEPLLAVRVANLEQLNRAFPGSPEAREASQRASGDPDPVLRLTGARGLGADGLPHADAILASSTAPDYVRVMALGLVAEHVPADRLSALILALADDRHAVLRRAAAEVLGRVPPGPVLPKLVARLEREDNETAAVFSRVLGQHAAPGTPGLEGALQALLTRDDFGCAVAAAEALGAVGTAASVPKLLAQANHPYVSPAIRRACSAAAEKAASRPAPATAPTRVDERAGAADGAEPAPPGRRT